MGQARLVGGAGILPAARAKPEVAFSGLTARWLEARPTIASLDRMRLSCDAPLVWGACPSTPRRVVLRSPIRRGKRPGEVPERLNGPVSKTGEAFGSPRVRIPPSPLHIDASDRVSPCFTERFANTAFGVSTPFGFPALRRFTPFHAPVGGQVGGSPSDERASLLRRSVVPVAARGGAAGSALRSGSTSRAAVSSPAWRWV